MAAGSSVLVNGLCSLVEVFLCYGHAVNYSVHASVPAPVQPVADGCVIALSRRGWKRRRPVEAGEATFTGEAARVTDLDQQLGHRALGQATELPQGGPALLH